MHHIRLLNIIKACAANENTNFLLCVAHVQGCVSKASLSRSSFWHINTHRRKQQLTKCGDDEVSGATDGLFVYPH